MTWNLSNNIVEGHPYTSLTINTKIYCTITSVQVFFVVKFLDVHSMKDDSNNTLATPILQARAFPFTYISDAEAAALSGSGVHSVLRALLLLHFVLEFHFSKVQQLVLFGLL